MLLLVFVLQLELGTRYRCELPLLQTAFREAERPNPFEALKSVVDLICLRLIKSKVFQDSVPIY